MNESGLEYFRLLPWCRRYLDDPAWEVRPISSRTPKPNREDDFFGRILNTFETIPHCLMIVKKPCTDAPMGQVRCFMTLESALNGWPGIAHGGLTAFALDEIVAISGSQYRAWKIEEAKARGEEIPRTFSLTAGLNIKYLKPVNTPQTVCVVASCVKQDKRKLWANGHIENSEGVPLVTARGFFILVEQLKL